MFNICAEKLSFSNSTKTSFKCPKCGKPSLYIYLDGYYDEYAHYTIHCQDCQFETCVGGDTEDECKTNFLKKYYTCDICGFSEDLPIRITLHRGTIKICPECLSELHVK